MEFAERWLKRRALLTSLAFALVVCYLISGDGVVSEEAVPFGDGEEYALRCLTLYGLLHTGQWVQFWDEFTLPRQSLAPLHYWIFFLLPRSLASMTSYGAISVLSNYGMMALGAWGMCRALGREQWTPALFLLCATQNISLDCSYFYFADVPFFAVGMVALACQLRAWREPSWRSGALSGALAGAMFWIKPANAVIFAATWMLAELARFALLAYRAAKDGGDFSSWRQQSLRHLTAIAAGFVPVSLLAVGCGGMQSIFSLIDANEVSGRFVTEVHSTGLFRLLYFPLCLTFFYHAVLMLLIFTALVAAPWFLSEKAPVAAPASPSTPPFPSHLFVPLLVSYLVLGEVYSFGMVNKEMRSMLLVLPVGWLAFFWLLERMRIRAPMLLLAAVSYAACAFSQVLYNSLGMLDVSTESFQLKGDWLTRLPLYEGYNMHLIRRTQGLYDFIQEALPHGGKVALGSERIFLTAQSFKWVAQHNVALDGKRAPYEFENFLAPDGRYCRSGLLNAQGIVVFTADEIQYSAAVQRASNALIQFCWDDWFENGKVKIATLDLPDSSGHAGYMVVCDPLRDEQITELLEATHATELPPDAGFNALSLHRLSWEECREILVRWGKKRIGMLTP